MNYLDYDEIIDSMDDYKLLIWGGNKYWLLSMDAFIIKYLFEYIFIYNYWLCK